MNISEKGLMLGCATYLEKGRMLVGTAPSTEAYDKTRFEGSSPGSFFTIVSADLVAPGLFL